MLSAFAKAISRYHDGEIPYIKLLDGGLVDLGAPRDVALRIEAGGVGVAEGHVALLLRVLEAAEHAQAV